MVIPVALPFRRQPLGKFLHAHKLTHVEVALVLDCNPARVNNLIQGRSYPTGAEIAALEKLFSLPIHNMFEPALLKFYNAQDGREQGDSRTSFDIHMERARRALDDARRALDASES